MWHYGFLQYMLMLIKFVIHMSFLSKCSVTLVSAQTPIKYMLEKCGQKMWTLEILCNFTFGFLLTVCWCWCRAWLALSSPFIWKTIISSIMCIMSLHLWWNICSHVIWLIFFLSPLWHVHMDKSWLVSRVLSSLIKKIESYLPITGPLSMAHTSCLLHLSLSLFCHCLCLHLKKNT